MVFCFVSTQIYILSKHCESNIKILISLRCCQSPDVVSKISLPTYEKIILPVFKNNRNVDVLDIRQAIAEAMEQCFRHI